MPASVEFALTELSELSGFIAAALVDSQTGSILGKKKNLSAEDFNVEVASAGNARGMVEKLKTIKALGLDEQIEDIVIVLTHQYHIVRPVAGNSGVFLYCVLQREKSNLLIARALMGAVIRRINIQPISV